MKNILILSLTIILLISSCKKNDEKPMTSGCLCENPSTQLEKAKSLIIGNWIWVMTNYIARGSTPYSETPQSTNKTLVFKFTADSLMIIQNDTFLEKERYSVEQMKDFTKYQGDTELVMSFYQKDGQFGVSLLRIDEKCMTLDNSYNDAGGELQFKRE